MITAHPLRETLHNEVHARPYERMTAPLALTHIAVLPTADGTTRAHLDALLRARLLPLPTPDASHLSIELGGGHFPWGEVSVKSIVAPSCGHGAGDGDIAVLVLERAVHGVKTRAPRWFM